MIMMYSCFVHHIQLVLSVLAFFLLLIETFTGSITNKWIDWGFRFPIGDIKNNLKMLNMRIEQLDLTGNYEENSNERATFVVKFSGIISNHWLSQRNWGVHQIIKFTIQLMSSNRSPNTPINDNLDNQTIHPQTCYALCVLKTRWTVFESFQIKCCTLIRVFYIRSQ